jgi:hypothetical protein
MDIALVVEADLVREKDIHHEDRVELSNEKLGLKLKDNPKMADLILLTRVFVVSNGSATGCKGYGRLGFGVGQSY